MVGTERELKRMPISCLASPYDRNNPLQPSPVVAILRPGKVIMIVGLGGSAEQPSIVCCKFWGGH
jgi:hypothetical protein